MGSNVIKINPHHLLALQRMLVSLEMKRNLEAKLGVSPKERTDVAESRERERQQNEDNVLANVISSMLCCGEVEWAYELMSLLRLPDIEHRTNREVIRTLFLLGKVENAILSFNRLKDIETSEMLDTIVSGLLNNGLLSQAIDRAMNAEPSYEAVAALIDIARYLLRKGEEQDARACLEKAISSLDYFTESLHFANLELAEFAIELANEQRYSQALTIALNIRFN